MPVQPGAEVKLHLSKRPGLELFSHVSKRSHVRRGQAAQELPRHWAQAPRTLDTHPAGGAQHAAQARGEVGRHHALLAPDARIQAGRAPQHRHEPELRPSASDLTVDT